MADWERRRLEQPQTISKTTIHGNTALAVGLACLALGTLCLWLARWGLVPRSRDGREQLPAWAFASLATVFAAGGISLIVHRIRGGQRRRRSDARVLRSPEDRWLADHPWDPSGASDRQAQRGWSFFLVGLPVYFLFIAPFVWMGFVATGDEQELLFGLIAVAVFGSLLGVEGTRAALDILRSRTFGPLRIRYEAPPFRLGGLLRVQLLVPDRLRAPTIRVELRCVQEQYEETSDAGNRRHEVVSYRLYADRRELDLPTHPTPGAELEVTFQLPEPRDAPDLTTCLSERPARYWELVAYADAPGVDYRAWFLVPVYR